MLSQVQIKYENVCTAVVHLVEYPQKCDYIWFKVRPNSLVLTRLYSRLLFGNLTQVYVLMITHCQMFYNNSEVDFNEPQ